MAVPTAYDTREFQRSDGPSQHNAVTAWSAGYSGKGVTIAVVDSGIDVRNSEFSGRIAAASRDMYADRDTLLGTDDHGNRVALVAAAARDNAGVLGMAWGATVLALRTDEPGTCGTTSDPGSGCSFSDTAIAEAVTYAADNGARVVNISLGGGSAGTVLTDAVRDATARGVLVVLAAGNDGLDSQAQFTQRLVAAGGAGVLVVGSIDEEGALSSFSNKAGADVGNYLVARGESVCCVYDGSSLYVDEDGFAWASSGTSFATPQVSGAAALLAQAFPHLTGAQIGAILLESAFDAGAAGDDAVYGHGVLDVNRAMQPLGSTSLAGGEVAVSTGAITAVGSGAMGDALVGVSLPTLVTDRYDRAFATDLGRGLRSAGLAPRLGNAVLSHSRQVAMQGGGASLSFSIAEPALRADPVTDTPGVSSVRRDNSRVLAAEAVLPLASGTRLGIAHGIAAQDLAAQLQGRRGPAFMIAADPMSMGTQTNRADMAVALRRTLGPWGLTLSAESGAVLTAPLLEQPGHARIARSHDATRQISLAFDRPAGPLDTAVSLTWLAEDQTLLGARFHDALGISGSDTLFADFHAGWQIAPDWHVGAALRQGFTQARQAGPGAGGRIGARAWSFDIARLGVFDTDDSLAFRLAQPLRVESGSLALALPQSWDYSTLTAGYGSTDLSLAPHGREIMGELAWSGSLFEGRAGISLYYRHEPGHYADMPADAGAALRWSRTF